MNCKTHDLWDPKTSIGVRASNNENSHSENDDYPLRASKMKDLRHPAKPFFQNESDVNGTIHSNEESDVEDYHMVTGANRQLPRQISQNPQYQGDMTGSHGSQNTSTSLEKQLNPNNQISKALKKLGNKNLQPLYFHKKTTTLRPRHIKKQWESPVEQTTGPERKNFDELTQPTVDDDLWISYTKNSKTPKKYITKTNKRP